MRRGSGMRKKISLGTVVAYALSLLLLASILYPFAWLGLSTFKSEKDIIQYPPRFFASGLGFASYVKVWQSLPLLTFFKNTTIFAGCVTAISILFDSMAGYAFARMRFKGRELIFSLILLTMMIPFQVLMIPLFLEVFKLGLLDSYAGLILPRMADAFGIFLMRSFFVSLPKDLEEAGRVDGLSEFQIFFKIMFPLCKSAVITLCIFNLMGNWNDLLYPLMLTSSTKMRTLSAGLATLVGQRAVEYGPTLTGTMLAVLPLIALYLFAQKYFVEGVATTGMKG
jgi:multiple sugar transport system permease protein